VNNLEQSRPMVSVISVAVGIAVVGAFLLRSTMSPSKRAEPVPQKTYETSYPILRHNGATSAHSAKTVADQLSDVLDEANQVQRMAEFRVILTEWASRDPEAALAYVRTMKIGPEHTDGILIVLQAIGRTDPDRAILLANDMVKDSEQAAIYNSLFSAAAAIDVSRALRTFNFVPEGEGRDNALRALTGKWAATDAQACLDWANGLANERERDIARESTIDALVKTDPTKAIALAQENLAGDDREQICSTAIRRLCERNPEAARDAFAQLDADSQQPFTTMEVARALAGKDLNSAIAWAESLPEGASRDAAVNFLTRVTAQAEH
jgi:hypothetical protein